MYVWTPSALQSKDLSFCKSPDVFRRVRDAVAPPLLCAHDKLKSGDIGAPVK